MRLVDGGLLVKRVPDEAVSLDELLSGVTEANVHAEVDAGPARGGEVW